MNDNRHIPSDALVDEAYGAWVNAGMAGKKPRDRIAAALEVAKRCGWLTEAAEPADAGRGDPEQG